MATDANIQSKHPLWPQNKTEKFHDVRQIKL